MTRSEKLCLMREMYESGSSIEAIAEATGYKVNSVNFYSHASCEA